MIRNHETELECDGGQEQGGAERPLQHHLPQNQRGLPLPPHQVSTEGVYKLQGRRTDVNINNMFDDINSFNSSLLSICFMCICLTQQDNFAKKVYYILYDQEVVTRLKY